MKFFIRCDNWKTLFRHWKTLFLLSETKNKVPDTYYKNIDYMQMLLYVNYYIMKMI